MSDYTENPARPVSLFTIFFLLLLLAAFLFFVRYFYAPAGSAPQNVAAEKLSKEMEWRATAASRRATLQETIQTQVKLVSGYAWLDQSAGVVRLPIERAMELVVEEHGSRKPGGANRGTPANQPIRR